LRIKKTVERSSRVLNLERFDRLGRDCTTLAGLSFKLAEDGDISAAEMVGPYSANLLRIFQFYVERHRRKRVELMIQEGRVLADELDDRRFAIDEDEAKVVPPTSPTSALADIVYRCAITGNSASTLALAISEKMIGTSDPSDSLTSQAISILHELAGADASRAGAVLAIATKVGLRSLEIDDPFTFERAAKFIAQQEDDKTPSSLAVLSASSSAYSRRFWIRAFDCIDGAFEKEQGKSREVFDHCFIGASALHFGNLSGAARIASRLEVRGLTDHLLRLNNKDSIHSLGLRASLSGLVLGSSPADSLANFVGFCSALRPKRSDLDCGSG